MTQTFNWKDYGNYEGSLFVGGAEQQQLDKIKIYKDRKEVATVQTIAEAATAINGVSQQVHSALRGEINTANGFVIKGIYR